MWIIFKQPLDSEAYVENLVTTRADKQPFGGIALSLKTRVKTIFISTGRTDPEILFHF